MGGSRHGAPCRLNCILAREADVAVVFRRGPTRWTQIVRWDTRRDLFEPGHWVCGSFYHNRCDLSPDGRWMIYLAVPRGGGPLPAFEGLYAVTAISRPPYLAPLAMWSVPGTWNGGGLFVSGTEVWLNAGPGVTPEPAFPPVGLEITHNPEPGGEDGPVLRRRLRRDGWMAEGVSPALREDGAPAPEYLVKAGPGAQVSLVMTNSAMPFRNWKGDVPQRFSVRHGGGTDPLVAAEWADWDRSGRLVFARAGALWAATAGGNGVTDEHMLADFNAAAPEEVDAPDWATEW